MVERKSKRVLFVADPHCGSEVGLTPPDYWAVAKYRPEISDLQIEMWKAYTRIVDGLKPIDIVILLGDGIEGKSERDGGKGLITSDRNEQATMCAQVILYPNADKRLVIAGTQYHVGKDEDYEAQVADKADAEFSLREWVDVNGVVFDLKHKVSGSTIPHGRFTALAREKLWNYLWAERDVQPDADVLLRSHVHYHVYCGGPDWLAMILPALQAPATRYGKRDLSGTVDWGVVYFDVADDGNFEWDSVIETLKGVKAKPMQL